MYVISLTLSGGCLLLLVDPVFVVVIITPCYYTGVSGAHMAWMGTDTRGTDLTPTAMS